MRRDPADPSPLGLRVRIARRDAGDVRRVPRLLGVERPAGEPPCRPRRREGAGDDHLCGGERELPLRKACRHRVARGVEERMGLVDPVVDDPDLDAGPVGGESRCRQVARVDGVGVRPGEHPVRRACVDPLDPGEPVEARKLPAGQDDGEAVRNEAVPPADGRVGNGRAERLDEPLLLGIDPRACARRVGIGERRRRQLHHDLRPRRHRRRNVASVGRRAEQRGRRKDEEREEKAPHRN